MLCCAVLCSGWAAADALVLRTFPILSGAWTPQFDMGHVISAVQANVFIVSSGGADHYMAWLVCSLIVLDERRSA
jgi:hypothetical protein